MFVGQLADKGGESSLNEPTLQPDPRPASLASDGRGELSDALLPEPTYFGLNLSVWLEIVILSVLMAAVFRFSLFRLVLKTNPINGEANWGHSFCVPVIGLYYLYLNREDLLAAPVKAIKPGTFKSVQEQ